MLRKSRQGDASMGTDVLIWGFRRLERLISPMTTSAKSVFQSAKSFRLGHHLSMGRDAMLLVRVMLVWGLAAVNIPLAAAQEFGVVEDLSVGRHMVSPFGGLGRYQNLLVQSEDLSTTWADATATAVTVSANLAAAKPAPDGK